MKTKKTKTRVIFRAFKDGNIIALLPHICENNGGILSYMHVGQHGSASKLIVYDTKPAKPEQYKDLLKELVSIGYRLEIGKRISKAPRF